MAATPASARARIQKILAALDHAYPKADTALRYRTPLELLIATILSAQCTDELVNKVTVDLFAKYRTAQDYARATPAALAKHIARVNFYRTKAKHLHAACRLLVERFGGRVPNRMDDLVQLQGVARKTANVVLNNAFKVPSGIVVDTHVIRLSQRLGLTAQTDRDKIEQDLLGLIPQPHWIRFGHQLILHGRQVCKARGARCGECVLGAALCPSYLRV